MAKMDEDDLPFEQLHLHNFFKFLKTLNCDNSTYNT